jgi:hypothetical protein
MEAAMGLGMPRSPKPPIIITCAVRNQGYRFVGADEHLVHPNDILCKMTVPCTQTSKPSRFTSRSSPKAEALVGCDTAKARERRADVRFDDGRQEGAAAGERRNLLLRGVESARRSGVIWRISNAKFARSRDEPTFSRPKSSGSR